MLRENKIIAVVTIEDVKKSLDLAKCLYDSGIVNLDIRLRTKNAKKAIELISGSGFNFNIGVGTVLTKNDLNFVKSSGIKYAFSPITDVEILNLSKELAINFIPGISNIHDVNKAINCECNLLKYFPAEKLGGLVFLNSIINQSIVKDLKFIAMGGINSSNAEPYLKHNNIIGIGSSWIAEKELIKNDNWIEISKRAKVMLNL